MRSKTLFIALSFGCSCVFSAPPQAGAGSGTFEVTVVDPSSAVISGAVVEISNTVTGYRKSVATAGDGIGRLTGVPQNQYHLAVTAAGFAATTQDVQVRSAVPVTVSDTLQLASETTSVEVHSDAGDMIESVAIAHKRRGSFSR